MTLKGWIKTTKRIKASSTYDLEGLRKKVELMAELKAYAVLIACILFVY
jgi:hypothetical protein